MLGKTAKKFKQILDLSQKIVPLYLKIVHLLNTLKKSSMKQIVSVLFLLIFSTVLLFAQNYPIGNRSITYTDAARSNRSVAVVVQYPATAAGTDVAFAAGTFPVVIFGHGFAMSGDNYDNIGQALVPQGYVVVLVNTETSLFGTSHGNFAGDLAFMAQKMQSENSTSTSPFFQKLTNKTAIMGHSMGGGATILAAANNTQIATTVTLAPAETDPSSISAALNTKVPSLVVVGEDDCVVPAADGPTPIYNNFTGIPKAFVSIINGNHCNFSDGSSFNCNFGEGSSGCSNSYIDQQHAAMNAAIFPWLNYWLKGNCTALSSFVTTIGGAAYNQTQTKTSLLNFGGRDLAVCQGSGAQFESYAGGSNYVWSPATGLSATNIARPTATPSATTTYTVNFTNSNGCAVSDQVVVTVNALPAAAISSSVAPVGSTVTVCGTTGTQLQAQPSGNGYTYRWFKNGVFTGYTVTGGTVKKAGTYTVEVTRTSTGCKKMSAPLTIVVNPCKNEGEASELEFTTLVAEVYPIPAHNQLTIDYSSSSTVQLSIVDLLGRTVSMQQLPEGTQQSNLDLSQLSAGQYMLLMNNGTEIVSKNIVVQ